MLNKLSCLSAALLLALLFFNGSALAACTNPLVIKDGSGASQNMSVSTNADGGCQYNMSAQALTWGGATLGAATAWGVIPSGSVIGVNANLLTVPSGAYLAGSYAGGALSAGAFAVGSISNGADVAEGSTTDAPCTLPATAAGCSAIALQKATANAASSPLATGTNSIGTVQPGNTPNTVPWLFQGAAAASGGWTPTLFAALSTTVQQVKGTAGQLAMLYCDNPNTSAIYVETFDVASATTVTLGTTVPKQAYYIPATNAAGFSLSGVGDQYILGIKIAVVTAYNGSTAPTTPGNCNVSWN